MPKAIGAVPHDNDNTIAANRRRHHRFRVGQWATLLAAGRSLEALVVDVSANGIGIQGDLDLAPGELLLISHPGWGSISGNVTRAAPGFAAITFDVAADSATFALKAVLGNPPGE
jgi:hypothetical protein